jgi:hypothetical protein
LHRFRIDAEMGNAADAGDSWERGCFGLPFRRWSILLCPML